MKKYLVVILLFVAMTNCTQKKEVPFIWENANIYFLLTDRFNNGDASNDLNFDRDKETGKLRGFKGGDIKGITQKIEEGYFNNLGISAIWFTPVVEQIHGYVNEGTGVTYGFHGYWANDWTTLDPNFGTVEDLSNLVELAHKNGIRIVMDGVINHTGPVTESDPVWPKDWVRTEPKCNYSDYISTVTCTLVKNLPDIRTESTENVEIPKHLANKWKTEGRYEQEMQELDAFFKRTGYPKAPKYYIIKWLTDYIVEFGIDGYRADTVKHIEEDVWADFKIECDYAFAQWKKENPEKVLDENAFYIVGEVYNYKISGKQFFNFGDRKVNYFENGFQSMINFEFKQDANNSYEVIFSKYSKILNEELKNYGILNYVSSHDDSNPFDKDRTKTFESATKLMLCPGTAQVYYGDESARSLIIEGTVGDATLRGFMNWEDIRKNSQTKEVLKHWQKLGKFRNNHPSVGAGIHKMISEAPYVFQRTYTSKNYMDKVIIGLDLKKGVKSIQVGTVFKDGDQLSDAYSNVEAKVKNGVLELDTPYNIVLLEKKQ